MRIYKDRAIGIIILFLGIILTFITLQIPKSFMAGDPGSKIFPMIGCVTLLLCGIGLFFSKPNPNEKVFLTPKEWKRGSTLFLIFCAYVLALDILGFLISTVIMLYVISTLFSVGKKVPQANRIIFSIAVTALVYVIFVKILIVMLPTGILF